MIYYELHVRYGNVTNNNGGFQIDFGDYDKKVVQQEIEDRIGSEYDEDDKELKRKDYLIIEKEEN